MEFRITRKRYLLTYSQLNYLTRTIRHTLLVAALLLAATVARAQYYSWGADAASLRWRTIRTPDVQVIFPDTAGAIARRTLHFIEAARPSIGY